MGRPLTENPLSEREMEVARLLVTGASNSEIARELVISPHTVKVHLRNIFEKLHVSSRIEASMLLVRRGWVTIPGIVAPPTPAVVSLEPAPASEPALPPDPPSLSDLPPTIRSWQRLIFIIALAIALASLAAPYWRSQARTSPPLLSDAGARTGDAPQIELEPRWEARAPLPGPRSRLAAAQVGEILYALGGETTGGRLLRALDAIDLRVNRWRSLAPLPQATSNLGAAALDGYIYAAGGTQASLETGAGPVFSDKLWRYSIADNQWSEVGALPGPLTGAALAADDSSLYLVGGWDGALMHDKVWKLTPSEDGSLAPQWEQLTTLPTPRAFLGAVISGRELYVAGGFDGQRELADAAVFNLDTGEWRILPPMANARSGHALVSDGLAIFALGGGWLAPVNNHERYDPVIDVWSNFPSPVPNEWRHLAAAGQDGQVFVLGGWSGDYLDANLQYQSSFRALLPVITND
jgi:DNA-binding CsgD family transcriptional regulator/N-acetylneuraminic acid mutarotase